MPYYCRICNVPMSRGYSKGPKPIVCSKSICKKKWNAMHGPLHNRRNIVPRYHPAVMNLTDYAEFYLEPRD